MCCNCGHRAQSLRVAKQKRCLIIGIWRARLPLLLKLRLWLWGRMKDRVVSVCSFYCFLADGFDTGLSRTPLQPRKHHCLLPFDPVILCFLGMFLGPANSTFIAALSTRPHLAKELSTLARMDF